MPEIDRKLIEESCKKVLLDIAIESKHLKENTTFKQQVNICNKIVNMSYNESISYIFNNGELLDEFGIRDFEGKFRKFLKYGLAALAGTMYINPLTPAMSMVAYYLFRKATDPCWQACVKKFPLTNEKQICKYECQVNAAKNIVRDIRTEMSKCSQTKNPPKCEKALQSQYIKWSKKVQEQIIKLRQATAKRDEKERKRREKEKKKEAKLRAKGAGI